MIEDSQYYPVLIQSAISFFGILLSAALAYYFSQKRYTYEKLFDRKLSYIEDIYGMIISLEKDLKKYIFTIGADMKPESLSKKKEEIDSVQKKFFELQDYFWKKEIILDQDSIIVIQSFINISMKILGYLVASIISQQLKDNRVANKQWHDSYQLINDVKEGLSNAKEQLKDDFKNTIKK